MDRLDTLEAQSIYVLREAFANLDKLAVLWSLGKDSNVVISGHARRHGKEVLGDVRLP
jgi:3'-phosphoadenosine 5'-phosphosulfate sulfotransferase (PAPS reductase)/FAD synthetase